MPGDVTAGALLAPVKPMAVKQRIEECQDTEVPT